MKNLYLLIFLFNVSILSNRRVNIFYVFQYLADVNAAVKLHKC